jgi:hypothetical protein
MQLKPRKSATLRPALPRGNSGSIGLMHLPFKIGWDLAQRFREKAKTRQAGQERDELIR